MPNPAVRHRVPPGSATEEPRRTRQRHAPRTESNIGVQSGAIYCDRKPAGNGTTKHRIAIDIIESMLKSICVRSHIEHATVFATLAQVYVMLRCLREGIGFGTPRVVGHTF